MKLLTILLVLTMLIACSGNKESEEVRNLKAQIEALKQENASMKSGEKRLKTTVAEYNKFLVDIEKNLAEIDASKAMVAQLNKEVKSTNSLAKDIRAHIANIKTLMENSRLKVVAMDKSLSKLRKESEGKSDEILELDRRVKSLTNDLLVRDSEIELLDGELAEMEDLYEMEAQNVLELKAIINKAFYIASSEKQLKSLGVITKEGGFIGIGKVKMIKANMADSLFTQIKKDETLEIALNTRKAQMITSHPEGSFELAKKDEKVEKLVILDPAAFWKNGNYVVVQAE